MSTLVIPGQPLSSESGPQASLRGGEGTFTRDGKVYASLLGAVHRDGGVIAVTRNPNQHDDVNVKPLLLPRVGSVVVGQVLRVNRVQISISILIVYHYSTNNQQCQVGECGGGSMVGQDIQGIVRVQDVRLTEQDKIKMWTCFRPGDIVRAEVISLPVGQGGYLLSTAKNSLGVLFARHSDSQQLMRAVSWEEMEDEGTDLRESRKVAGPE